ncbi:MAG TPA: hypothetical protein VLA75_03025 [Thermoanaerobaculia bacterium]|nr:hypothetical protein [Thermoanaerobaculia bacterium]
MGVIAEFGGGWVLDTDPRREDPLYYCLKDGDWSGAIAFEVLPLWEEERSTEVTVQVCHEHRGRESSLDFGERERLYSHVLIALCTRFRKWSRICVRGAGVEAAVCDSGLARAMGSLGFRRDADGGDDGVRFVRAGPGV